MMHVDGVSILIGVATTFLGLAGVAWVGWLTEQIKRPTKSSQPAVSTPVNTPVIKPGSAPPKREPGHKSLEMLLGEFLVRHGWEAVDLYENKRPCEAGRSEPREVREELSKKPIYFKFNTDGDCLTLHGSYWKAVIYELNRLWVLESSEAPAGENPV